MRRAAGAALVAVLLAGCGSPAAPKGFPAQTRTQPKPPPLGAGLPKGATAVADLTQRAYIRPEHLELADHDDVRGLRWTGWGSSRAVGRGTLTTNPCTPDCATAKPLRVAATVELSALQRCLDRPWYGHAVVAFEQSGRTRRLTEPLSAPC